MHDAAFEAVGIAEGLFEKFREIVARRGLPQKP
jgi:hypothetical protein